MLKYEQQNRINCTVVELKQINQEHNKEMFDVLIVPLWN